MALENVRPGRRITALESFVVTMAAAERYRFVTTPEYGQTIACADHTSVYFNHTAPLRGLAGALLWMAQHEMEHHGDAAVVAHFPTVSVPDAATAVLPVVASAGTPPTNTGRTGPSVRGSVPNGPGWTRLAAVGLEVRHASASPVTVWRTDFGDGSRVLTLPADGFPGATWEIRSADKPTHAHPHLNANGGCLCYCSGCVSVSRDGSPKCCCPDCAEECSAFKFEGARGIPPEFEGRGVVPATGPAADVCGRCGGHVVMDQARAVLPPPYGSLNAMHPLTLCGSCNDGLVELVAAYVRSEPVPATGPVLRVDLDADKCPNCLASIQRCNAGGCGMRQAPGWRVAQQNGNGMEVRG